MSFREKCFCPKKALKKYSGTIFLVSHDIDFVRDVATSVLEITPSGIRSYPGGYDYYCEKKAEAAAAKPQVASVVAKAPEKSFTSDGGQKLTSKELRQLRAQERAKTAPLVKELKKKVETARNIQMEVEPGVIAYIERFESSNNTAYRFSLDSFEGNSMKSHFTARTLVYTG